MKTTMSDHIVNDPAVQMESNPLNPHQRFTCLLNAAEARQCRYALDELANSRAEQAIDWKKPHLNEEAQSLRELAARIAKLYRL